MENLQHYTKKYIADGQEIDIIAKVKVVHLRKKEIDENELDNIKEALIQFYTCKTFLNVYYDELENLISYDEFDYTGDILYEEDKFEVKRIGEGLKNFLIDWFKEEYLFYLKNETTYSLFTSFPNLRAGFSINRNNEVGIIFKDDNGDSTIPDYSYLATVDNFVWSGSCETTNNIVEDNSDLKAEVRQKCLELLDKISKFKDAKLKQA